MYLKKSFIFITINLFYQQWQHHKTDRPGNKRERDKCNYSPLMFSKKFHKFLPIYILHSTIKKNFVQEITNLFNEFDT